jgi:hypothetical protein
MITGFVVSGETLASLSHDAAANLNTGHHDGHTAATATVTGIP